MTMRLILATALFALGAISCKTTKDAVTQPANLQDVNVSSEELVFKLKKGACYGNCPHYEFNIYNNLYAEFIGARNTDKIGTYAKFITNDELKELVTAYDKAGFHSLDDKYPSNIADLPTIYMSYQKDNILKTLSGKRERPESVHKLQFMLEKISEHQNGWTKISDNTGINIDTKINKSQIVIDIAKGNELARWFEKMKTKYGFQIIERLNNDSSSWLVTYNTKLHKAEDVLSYLQSDPVVGSAKFKKESN